MKLYSFVNNPAASKTAQSADRKNLGTSHGLHVSRTPATGEVRLQFQSDEERYTHLVVELTAEEVQGLLSFLK